jgi:thiol-disulfide isomerase/thioredoxin
MAKDPAESAMATDDAMEKEEDADADAAMSTDGAWIDQAAYEADAAAYHEAGDVVLFFNASWCPTCQATVKSLDAEGAPAGLTVVSVDYDNSAELKQQYGVTVQHTFVQVDEAGNELATFTGSTSGDEIASNTV